jgi:hypothetical protein
VAVVANSGEPVGVTIGVTGQQSRWSVTPWGAIVPWGSADLTTLDWYVAADDRWHVPAQEPTVRQIRIAGAPVVETRVRIPDGDAVQRVWAVPDGGGMVLIEFENESPKPIAIALAGAAVLTERPIAEVPIQGIDLPDDAIAMPVGHKAAVRVALRRPNDQRPTASLAHLPPVLNVVRGWTRVVEQASRLVLPDDRLVEAVVSARCDLLLEGPVDPGLDPAGFLLDVAELVRCGDSAEAWLLEIVEPAERLGRATDKRRTAPSRRAGASAVESDSEIVDALDAARIVAHRSGDQRATGDVDRLARRVTGERSPRTMRDNSSESSATPHAAFADLRRGASVGRFVRAVERRLADDGRLLAGGIPTTWLGNNFEVHGLPTSATTTVSYAVRWHGERPAVLWEQHGTGLVTLSAPDLDPTWTSDATTGETLWSAPTAERPKRTPLSLTALGAADLAEPPDGSRSVEGGSFS